MPLNIRAKPPQSKLSVSLKSAGLADSSSFHSRLSRSPKKGKQAASSASGSRSGLEPGSVSCGPPPGSKPAGGQWSAASILGSKTKPGAGADARPATGSATAPWGKTLSMENIQSLSAAYATSGTTYPSDRDALEPSGGYHKGTMTLGRTTNRSSYTGRSTAIGSTPNITSTGMSLPSDPYGDQTHHLQPGGSFSLRRRAGRSTQGLDSVGRGEGSTLDLQVQLRELQRENELLKREIDGGRDGRMGSSMNSVNFWSPEVKRDRAVRREEGVRTSILKEQYKTNQEDSQVRTQAEYSISVH